MPATDPSFKDHFISVTLVQYPSTSTTACLRTFVTLAERESKSRHARIEKLDFELPIGDGLELSDQLIQPLFAGRAVALVVDVYAVSSTRGPPVDKHAKARGCSWRYRSHDEMEIAGVKAVRDPPVGLVEHRGLFPDRPVAGKRPLVEAQPRGDVIDAGGVRRHPTRRREVFGALIADIVLRRLQALPIGWSFNSAGVYRNLSGTDPAVSGLGQQLLEGHFRLVAFPPA